MAKNWWFKLDFKIWRTDSSLRRCSLETRGFWLECLCVMQEMDTFEVHGTLTELARLLGCESNDVARCAAELKETKTANVTLGNGTVTLLSRRLKRELTIKEQTRLRVQRHRGNGSVTAQSNKQEVKSNKQEEKNGAIAPKSRNVSKPKPTTEEWLDTLKKESIYSHVDFDRELRKAEIWISEHPGRRFTLNFFTAWINRIEPTIQVGAKSTMSDEETKMREGVRKSQEMFYGK